MSLIGPTPPDIFVSSFFLLGNDEFLGERLEVRDKSGYWFWVEKAVKVWFQLGFLKMSGGEE